VLYYPTRLFFGDSAVATGSSHLSRLGKKALLVTGKHSAIVCGAQPDVIAHLKKLRIEYAIFNQVEENPTLDTVMAGVDTFAASACDFVIGIGGGSPIDAAKAIALAVANHLSKQDIYDTALFQSVSPIVAVPTTAGTGTEVTPYAVLTIAETQKKAGFGSELAYPVLALVDPGYTTFLNKAQTLYTGIDALSHLLEGIYSNKRNPLLYPLIWKGVTNIQRYLKSALTNPQDLQARTALTQASVYGGMVIAQTSTTLQHSIGYPLTSVYGVPHGLANGVVMRHMLELYYPWVNSELDELFLHLGMGKNDFHAWLESLELSMGVRLTEEFIRLRVPEIMASRNMANNPFPVSPEDIFRILSDIR